jgi:hypothetical protein
MHQYAVGHLPGRSRHATQARDLPQERMPVERQAEDITIQTHGYDKGGRINR